MVSLGKICITQGKQNLQILFEFPWPQLSYCCTVKRHHEILFSATVFLSTCCLRLNLWTKTKYFENACKLMNLELNGMAVYCISIALFLSEDGNFAS